MITSVQNPKIQWVRKLQAQARIRRQEGAFVVEGVRLVEEACQAGWQTLLALYTDELSERGQSLVERFHESSIAVEEVTPAVLKAASDTASPQGLLAVLAINSLTLPKTPDFLLIVDGVRDPGNLGTILRTAAAAGVQGVLLPPGGVDVFSPKVVRSGMGAHFRLPVLSVSWLQIEAILHPASPGNKLNSYLADAAGGLDYTHVDFCQPTALFLGGEAAGAGERTRALVDQRVHIPMPGEMESLNAAVAGAVLLFEVVRQRSQLLNGRKAP